jgi:hypothetical protein
MADQSEGKLQHVSTSFSAEDDWGMKVLYEPKEEVQTEHEIIE